MEIKKEEIEDYIENNLYFLCNQDDHQNKKVINELKEKKDKLLYEENSIVVEYNVSKIEIELKCEIIKICFRKNEINMSIGNVKE